MNLAFVSIREVYDVDWVQHQCLVDRYGNISDDDVSGPILISLCLRQSLPEVARRLDVIAKLSIADSKYSSRVSSLPYIITTDEDVDARRIQSLQRGLDFWEIERATQMDRNLHSSR